MFIDKRQWGFEAAGILSDAVAAESIRSTLHCGDGVSGSQGD